MHRIKFLIFVIGIIWSGFSYAEDGESEEIRAKKGLVYVEPSIIVTAENQEEYKLVPYRERRSNWGTTWALGYSTYEPVNYEPDFVPANFSDIYSSADLPTLEFTFAIKRNFSMGSIGAELGVGGYQNVSDNKELSDSKLTLIPVRVGLIYNLDALAPEPLFVPYVGGGVYSIVFKEELDGGNSNNGNTQISTYFHAGVAIGLDWIDKEGSRFAYQDSGIEATYAYVELQSYMASSNVADGDFSNELSYAGGVKVEF